MEVREVGGWMSWGWWHSEILDLKNKDRINRKECCNLLFRSPMKFCGSHSNLAMHLFILKLFKLEARMAEWLELFQSINTNNTIIWIIIIFLCKMATTVLQLKPYLFCMPAESACVWNMHKRGRFSIVLPHPPSFGFWFCLWGCYDIIYSPWTFEDNNQSWSRFCFLFFFAYL